MTSYYVSTSGNDSNSGTISSPWRTIQHAIDTISSGDIAYVRAGTYNEQVTPSKSGSSNSYITIQGYPNDSTLPIIDASNLVGQWQGALNISGVNWIKFSGFEIRNSGWSGVWIKNSSNIYIQNCNIHDIQRGGLYAESSSYITYDGNTVTATQQTTSSQENENVNMITVSNFEIKNNHIYNTAQFESIDCKIGCSYGLIHHNDITPNMSCGIYLDSWTGNNHDIDVYNNIIRANSNSGVRGIAIAVEQSGGNAKNIRIYNNIIYGVGAMGINPAAAYSVGPVDSITVVNNTVYNCGVTDNWGGGIVVEYGYATNVVLRNNICYQNGGRGDIYPNGNTTLDHNLTGTNPLFVNPSGADFHLQSGSPAIGAGSTAQFIPSFDFANNSRKSPTSIGAYEYASTSCTPNYQCRQPLDCYEHDNNNCPGSSDRQNSACCPSQCTPNYQCRTPLDCYEHDINNCSGSSDRQNSACCPSQCTPNYQCRTPLDCYEHDVNNCSGSSDRQNSACCPPPANNYGCSNGQCLQGYGNLPVGCNNTCTIPPFKCSPDCTPTQVCLLGTCIEKKYVQYGIIGFGALVALSLLS